MEIQTTIEKFPEKIRKLNISPKTSIRVIIEDEEITQDSSKTKKSRWAEIAEQISKESPLDEKAGEALRKASREFRDNFRFREPPSFEHTDNDS